MQEAMFYKKLKDKVQCQLCPHNCKISEGKFGICMARKNIKGKLQSLVYGKPVAVNIDPIEKKPLYHYLPETNSMSIGTVGCNLSCLHCQNWDIARGNPEKTPTVDLEPSQVVNMALQKDCAKIRYTYNEPTVLFAYAIDTAKLAKKKGIKNVLVTNGYINKEPALEFIKHMDGVNIDLKAFNDDFYKQTCKGKLQPVLDTLMTYNKKIWIEITNLLIYGKNDDFDEIRKMCKWISDNLGKGVPIHFSRAFPMFKMQDIIPTPLETLRKAEEIAKEYLDYVYIGNTEESSNTNCPKCGALLISRKYYSVINDMKGNKCGCGYKIAGVFS